MAGLEYEVLVIGGGATGAGVARDAAMRGFATVLVERGDLASGTTGRFHGQLHSGARYAVADPGSARECVREAATLRRIAPACIEDTGGFFVSLPGDDPTYPPRFLKGCRACGVEVSEISPAWLLAQEPALNPLVLGAFAVPDGVLDSHALVAACARSAQEHGARILTRREVRGVIVSSEVASGASLAQDGDLRATVVVNAAGAWSGRVAATAGCHLRARLSKGVMVAVPQRLAGAVVSRCRMPDDGDILVPRGATSVMGTTDTATEDPDDAAVDGGAEQAMLSAGDQLVPGFSATGRVRAWAAVRQLVGETSGTSREVSRSHRVIDHGQADGVEGFFTVTGGKATTFRLMAEEAVDAVCQFLRSPRPCRTATEPLDV